MIFDTHAHYDDKRFDCDREPFLASLPQKNVGLIVNPGCDGETSRFAVSLAQQYGFIYAAVGWHPEEWESWDSQSMPLLRALIKAPKVVAIGEIGLDYYWDRDHKDLQKEMFERQICLAIENGLPVIVHDREAHEDSLEMILRYPEARGVFHCYSGSAEMAVELLRRGWYLGFDGPVTYKNNKKAAAVLAITPLNRILVETDSPYMAPEPCRGQRNNSALLCHVLRHVAEAKGVSPEEMEKQTFKNGCELFGINEQSII